jgi:hypothetical protein
MPLSFCILDLIVIFLIIIIIIPISYFLYKEIAKYLDSYKFNNKKESIKV